jgi:sugar phosphate isomerase/epimerase
MSRHYGTIIEPDDQEDYEPHERDDFAEMQQELADIADRERKEYAAEAELFWQESITNKERIEDFRNEY